MSRTIGLFKGVFINYFQNAYIGKFIKRGSFCPTVLVIGRITYFFLGIGSCLGGLSTNDCNSRFITSETGLACSSPSLSRKSRILGVVRKAINSERFSFISFTMLNILLLIIKVNNIILC